MDIKQVVILVFIILAVVYFALNAFSKTSQLTKMADGKKIQTIKASELKNNNNSSNFTYSMWIFVDDWNYNFGQEKTVLDRSNGPTVVLGDKPNTLKIKMNYYDASKSATPPTGTPPTGTSTSATQNQATIDACAACAAGYTCACDSCNNGVPDAASNADAAAAALAAAAAKAAAGTVNTCLIENVPIQKWVNIIVSLYGLTMDVYLDGKLVRTCVMPGVPQVNNAADINVTSNKGFSGWTTNFKYWSDASNPQEAYNIYKSGFGGSILGNALSKYRVQVSMLKDNVQQGSFQI
jgi:hypothetical protein